MYVNFSNAPSILDEEGKIEHCVSDWSLWLLNYRQYSRNTADNYVCSLNLFFEYLKYYSRYDLSSPVKLEEFIVQYRNAILNGDSNLNWKPRSFSSVNAAINALASYLEYIGLYDIVKAEARLNRFALAIIKNQSFLGYLRPGKLVRLARQRKRNKYTLRSRHEPKVVKYFPPDQFWDFIDLIPKHRDRALYLLMAGTSARVSQALNVWQKDVLFDEERILFIDPRGNDRSKELKEVYGLLPDDKIQSKGNLPGVWLPGPIKQAFFREARLYFEREYIPMGHRSRMHPYFFITKTGERLYPIQVRHQFKRIVSKLGIHDLSPHSLRHLYGYISHVILGISLEILMDNMGHRNIESTKIYAKIPSDVAEQKFKEALGSLLKQKPDGERQQAALKILTTKTGE